MKLLVFAEVYYPDIIGGGEYSTKMMAEGMVKLGHEVTVYCLGLRNSEEVINGVVIHREYREFVSEHFLSFTNTCSVNDTLSPIRKIVRKKIDVLYDPKTYDEFREVIKKEQPDVVHSVSGLSYMGRYNLWKAAFDLHTPISHVCRSSVLIEFHFMFGMLNWIYQKMNATASHYLTAMAAPSKYMLDCHVRKGICGSKFNEIIYNAVDFVPTKPALSLIKKKENIVLYAGSIRKEKGILTLVKAVKAIPNVQLKLIGNQVDDLHITCDDQISVNAWMDKDELYQLMQKSKVVVLPSECKEAFGRIIIEGVNNCTLAVGSDQGAIPEILDHDSRYIFKNKKEEELSKIILRIMSYSTTEYYDEICKQQIKMENHTIDTYISRWENFFLKQI